MTADSPRKVLWCALDAGEWSLVRRWAADGRLPHFARLLEQGAHGTLSTTAAQLPDTVWSCIYSGRNPATFAKYFYVQYDPSTGDLRHARDHEFTERPVWDLLAEAGRKVGVVDAVKIPASPKVEFMVANWGAHATKAPRASTPAALLDDLDRRFGRNPVGDVDRISDTARSRRDMRRRLLEGSAQRRRLLEHLITTCEWDVFVAGFSELHQAGHYFWQGVDPSHPRHRAMVDEGTADTVERVYREVDTTIGRLAELAGPDCLQLVVAGHGMGPIWHASWNIPEMLDLLGYGPRPARRAEEDRAAVVGRKNFWRTLKRVVPGRLQYAVKAALPKRVQDELLFKWYAGARDWQGWRAHAVPNNDSVGAIRVAVRGRDPHGSVEPQDHERILDDLQQAFEELKDPETGRSVVHRVTRLHDVFDGPYASEKPDLTICWEQSFPWHALESPRFGRLEIPAQDSRTGSHTPRGFFCAAGPGVAPGQVLEGHSIYDITPTILQAQQVELPDDLDGAPIPFAARPVST